MDSVDDGGGGMTGGEREEEGEGRKAHILRTEDMIPRHGFAVPWLGRRTRRRGRGGRRGVVPRALEGIFVDDGGVDGWGS